MMTENEVDLDPTERKQCLHILGQCAHLTRLLKQMRDDLKRYPARVKDINDLIQELGKVAEETCRDMGVDPRIVRDGGVV